MDIYNRLNNQPHLQDEIKEFVWKLEEEEDQQIWRTQHKHHHDLMVVEWNLFVEAEQSEGEGLHGEDASTPLAAASNIINYVGYPGQVISAMGYDYFDFDNSETFMRLPEDRRNEIIDQLYILDGEFGR